MIRGSSSGQIRQPDLACLVYIKQILFYYVTCKAENLLFIIQGADCLLSKMANPIF